MAALVATRDAPAAKTRAVSEKIKEPPVKRTPVREAANKTRSPPADTKLERSETVEGLSIGVAEGSLR